VDAGGASAAASTVLAETGAVAAGAGSAAPALTVETPVPSEIHHTVVAGDTLGRIASRYGVTVREIAERNGIQNVDRIRVGTVLVIPPNGEGS
jgi:LysM repeat protein